MAAETPSEVAALIDRARQARKNGAHAAALAAFEAAAEAAPANDGIKVEIACELRALDRLAEARTTLDGVLARAPHFTNALIELGHLCRRQNDHRGALTAFEGAAANHPDHVGMRLEIVRSLRALDRPNEAEIRLDQILAAHPSNLAALIERGHLNRRKGDHLAALKAFQEAAAVDGTHQGIALEIAQTLRTLARDDEAADTLRRLVAANPADAAALAALARQLADQGLGDEAEALLDAAPDSLATHGGLAIARVHVARMRGDNAAVLRHLERALALEPHNNDLALDLTAEKRRRGDIDGARGLIDRVFAARPDHPRAWVETGYLRRAAGDRAGATAAFEAAIAHQPIAQALVELAGDAWASGHPDDARTFLGRALQQDPNHLAALLTSAEHLLRSDDPTDALHAAERAVAAHPRSLDPRLVAARAAAAIPDRDRALSHLDEAQATFGERPEILASRIHVLRTLGEHAAAMAAAATAGDAATHEASWAEIAALRIFAGDFDGAKSLFDALPERMSKTARAHFFRGQLAESKRDYARAVAEYGTALRADPANGDGHGEMARASLLNLDLDAARRHLRLSMQHNAAGTLARGQSLNPSQHHVGQLLDEFALDSQSLRRLRGLSAFPADVRLARLKSLVRQRSESTVAAIALMLAARRAGAFRPETGSPIPRVVAQFWDSAEPPDDIRKLMASWDDDTGVWQHRVFDDQAADDFLHTHFGGDVRRAFRRTQHPAQRSDVFRLAYLAHEGGLYADADDRRVAPLASLLPDGARLVVYLENYGTVGNNFLAAAPRHPAIVRALELAVAAINRGDHDIVWLSTGPGLVTRAVARFLADTSREEAGSVAIRELFEMRQLVDIHCPARYKATTQHWSRAEFAHRRARANHAALPNVATATEQVSA